MYLNQILWQRGQRAQLIAAVIGWFIGLVILLFAIQLYIDFNSIIQKNAADNETYLVLNKRVNLLNTLGLKASFDAIELKDIAAQPFAKRAAAFTTNRFKVSASSSVVSFRTDLFLEALPDEMLDVPLVDFRWHEGGAEVPIVLSKDYLALYNFGFAPAQGLPQFTASTISRVSFDLSLSGSGKFQTYKGRVVGFSDRINSILAPQSFLDYANKTYGDAPDNGAARVIVAVNAATDKRLTDYIEDKGYEVSNGKLFGDSLGGLVTLVLGILGGIGVLIALLSALVFILNFQLLVSRAAPDIKLLLNIGYTPASISAVILRRLFIIFIATFAAALVALFALKYVLAQNLANQGININYYPSFATLIIGMLIGILFLWTNKRSVEQSVV